MKARQHELWQRGADALEKLPWLSAFQARLTNSVFKLVAASARLNGHDEPVQQDVGRAFQLIGRKFEFISTLAQHLNLARAQEVPEGEALDQWLLDRFAGQQCATKTILEAYQESFGYPPIRRTMERHLSRVAHRVRRGLWDFPALHETPPASSQAVPAS
jgi:hypothetical protein